jgi:hypothetical protein
VKLRAIRNYPIYLGSAYKIQAQQVLGHRLIKKIIKEFLTKT